MHCHYKEILGTWSRTQSSTYQLGYRDSSSELASVLMNFNSMKTESPGIFDDKQKSEAKNVPRL